MHAVFISGGSTGHLAPLVAVAEAWKEKNPDARISMICSDTPADAPYLRSEGYEPTLIVPRLRRNLSMPLAWWKSGSMSKKWLEAHKPDTIFCKGGALSIPFCTQAARRGIPIVSHESDVVMGRANRAIASISDIVCLGWKEAMPHDARNGKYVWTGNPVRRAVTRGSKEEGLKLAGFGGGKPILLITGGSQGAQAINEAVWAELDELLVHCDIIHQTGKGKSTSISRPGYRQMAFITPDDMPHILAAADMAVIRGGASSIAECAAMGIPAIIIPIQGLAQDHQVKNAEAAARSGGALIVEQARIREDLVPAVKEWSTDAKKREAWGKKLQTIHNQEASVQIAEILAKRIATSRQSN